MFRENSRSTIYLSILCRLLVPVILSLAPAAATAQDPKDSPTKLEELKVRHRTDHYAIAGTASQTRIAELGRCLEQCHAEFARAFGSTLKQDEKAKKLRGKKGDKKAAAKKTDKKKKAGKGKKSGASDEPADGHEDDGDEKPRKAEKEDKSKRAAVDRRGRGREEASITEPDAEDRFRVVILADLREYQTLGRGYLVKGAEFTNGMYVPELKVLILVDGRNSDDTYQTLFHESFHQLLDRYVKNAPAWLDEGLATYFGSARPGARGLAFTEARKDLWKLSREVVQDNKAIPFSELIAASRDAFRDSTIVKITGYGEGVPRKQVTYAQVYTFVNMLLSDPQGRKRLQNFVRELARDDGSHTQEIQNRYFDAKTCDRLSGAWVRYIQTRREFQ